MEMFFVRNTASRGWHVCRKTIWQNTRRGEKLGARKKDNKEATKIDKYAITWTIKRKDKLLTATRQIPREILRLAKFFINYGGRIEAKFFSSLYNPSPISSGGLEIILVVKCLISREETAILKQLQKLINLNYEEITSVDAPQNKVIVNEELGKNDTPEDKDIVFIDDGSASYSDYNI